MKYVIIQPPQQPPGNPGGVDPRSQPVVIEGGWILLAIGFAMGIYYLIKLKQTLDDKR